MNQLLRSNDMSIDTMRKLCSAIIEISEICKTSESFPAGLTAKCRELFNELERPLRNQAKLAKQILSEIK